MNNNFLSLEAEFQVQVQLQDIDFYLKNNPGQAHEQALNYCEFFLILAQKYKTLEMELKTLKEKQSPFPNLPPF